MANDTTFDANGQYTCVWMDQNYNWNDATFKNRSGASLNLAVNLIADVLHSFYTEAIIPEFPSSFAVAAFMVLSVTFVLFVGKKDLKRKT